MRDTAYFLATLLFVPSLSACGGTGQSMPAALPQGASAPLAPDAAAREAEADSTLLTAAPFVAGPSDLLYVANSGNNSITVYHTGASGNTAPIATIAGSNTELNGPGQVSEDASGDLFVANGVYSGTGSSILVFAHGANGNVPPIRVIAGPLTGLSSLLYAATVDKTTGKLFAVAQLPTGGGGASRLLRFAPNATGNEAPSAASQTLESAWELASNSTGANIIEASDGVCCSLFSQGVYTYKKQFPNERFLRSPIRSLISGIVVSPTIRRTRRTSSRATTE